MLVRFCADMLWSEHPALLSALGVVRAELRPTSPTSLPIPQPRRSSKTKVCLSRSISCPSTSPQGWDGRTKVSVGCHVASEAGLEGGSAAPAISTLQGTLLRGKVYEICWEK